MLFDFDIALHVFRFLPTFLRKPKIKDLATALLEPLKLMHSEFIIFRSKKMIEISYNNQTIMFEYGLNNVFDNSNRGITINNTYDDKIRNYIYNISESERVATIRNIGEPNLTPLIIYNTEEFGSHFGYSVNVPISLQSREDEIIAFIEKYKHIAVSYQILYY